MKIATWNVNSLRVRLPHVQDWLAVHQPDILALQETKVSDDQFPTEGFAAAGYQVVFSGQRTYNGVAIVSKFGANEVVKDVPEIDDPQRRILVATIGDVRVINLYVVNGSQVGSDKYDYKLQWLNKISRYVRSQLAAHPKTVVLGDFNITPDDRDVHDPELWKEKILCSTPERTALQHMLDLGLSDSFRLFDQEGQLFSWWDYRTRAFPRNAGLRIDLILTSKILSDRCLNCEIDTQPRARERPSDHAPVIATFQ